MASYLDVKREYKTKFGELCDKYKENYRHQACYQTAKRCFIKGFKNHFGTETLLANIGYVDLETYQNKLRETPTKHGYSRTNAAVNRQISCLCHMMRKGVEWEMLERSPFDRGKSLRLSENNARLRFLSEEEIDRLVNACQPSLKHLVVFCIHTGARRREALSLKWHQVKNGHIYFEQTKTDNPRQVPIDEDLQELFDRLRGKPKKNVINIFGESIDPVKQSDYVFLHKGKPFAPHAIQRFFKAACERAKIPYGIKKPDGVTLHTLRHTFGSWLAMKGASIKTIQELMGHRDISMTMRYAHLADSVKQQAISLLNGLTSKAQCHKTVTKAESTFTTNTQATRNTTIS